MFHRIREDIAFVKKMDPAARSSFEIFLTYSGLHAIWYYRLAHFFYRCQCFTVARIISQFARFITGIEIHPGATIGRCLFIDHGSGVVIGETAIVGNYVVLYQGVTLGGTGKEKGKRHPTIGNHVLIATGAKVLGSLTVGDYARVGAGSIVLHPVPANSTVVGIPARVVIQDGKRVEDDLNQTDLPDVIGEECKLLQQRVTELEQRLVELETSLHQAKEGDQVGHSAV